MKTWQDNDVTDRIGELNTKNENKTGQWPN